MSNNSEWRSQKARKTKRQQTSNQVADRGLTSRKEEEAHSSSAGKRGTKRRFVDLSGPDSTSLENKNSSSEQKNHSSQDHDKQGNVAVVKNLKIQGVADGNHSSSNAPGNNTILNDSKTSSKLCPCSECSTGDFLTESLGLGEEQMFVYLRESGRIRLLK